MAVRALLARDSGRGMVNKATHKCRRVVAVAAVGRWGNGYMTSDHAGGTQSIVTGLTRDGVPRQCPVIERTTQVESGGGVAAVTGLSNVARIGVRIRRRVFPGNRYAIGHHTPAIMAAALTAGARHDNLGIGVIRKRSRECRRGMTRVAFRGNAWVPRRTGIARGTNRDRAVVAGRAAASDTGVIERSVGI